MAPRGKAERNRKKRKGKKLNPPPDDVVGAGQDAFVAVDRIADGDRYVYHFEDRHNYAPAVTTIRMRLLMDRVGANLEVVLRDARGDGVIFVYKRKNVYYLGFSLDGVTYYEFGKSDDCKHEIPGSTYLGYTGSYLDLGANNLDTVRIDFWSFTEAIRSIIRGRGLEKEAKKNWLKSIRLRFPPLIVMLPEAFRFKWVFWKIRDIVLNAPIDETHTVPWWMEVFIRHWEKMSEVAFERLTPDVPYPPPPIAEDYVYGFDDVFKALNDCIWADNALEIHCLVELVPRHCLAKRRGQNGASQVLVEWNNKEQNWQDVNRMTRDFPSFVTKVRPQH